MAEYKSIDDIIVPRFLKENGFVTTEARSKLMSKIRGKNTKPEKLLRKALWDSGVRYRIHNKSLPGTPDISNKKYHFVIFVDGEFWHGYNWEEKASKIKTNRDFWIPKIERNIRRDIENNKKLVSLGYTVFRFWEHEIKKGLGSCIKTVLDHINLIDEHGAQPY